MITDALRARIRRRLLDLSMSMQKASLEAGASEAFLKHFLSGRQNDITVDKVFALARVLKTSATWLMTGEGDADVQPDEDTATVVHIASRLRRPNLMKSREYMELLLDSQRRDDEKAQ